MDRLPQTLRTVLMFVACAAIGTAAEPRTDSTGFIARTTGSILLKNGEVVTGQLTRLSDRYQVTLADGEIRVRLTDVDLVGRDLDELYQQRRAKLSPDRADQRLDLAEWCLRQSLIGAAATELSEAMRIDPKNARIAGIEQRLDHARVRPVTDTLPTTPTATPNAELTAINAELDRLVRSLPRGTMESFTRTIQPLLLNSCGTSGCHGPRSNSSYSLERASLGQVGNHRITQKNLQSTLGNVNFDHPEESRLLTMAARAHGGTKSPIFATAQSPQYQQLVEWVSAAVQPPQTAASTTNAPTKALMQTMSAMGFALPGESAQPDEQTQYSGYIRLPSRQKYQTEDSENTVGEGLDAEKPKNVGIDPRKGPTPPTKKK